MPKMRKNNPEVGVSGILQRHDGSILLGRRGHEPNPDEWAFPGGRVRWRESLADALGREFAEETGLSIRVQQLAHVSEVIDERVHFVVVTYFVTAVGDLSTAIARSDLAELTWCTWQECLQLSLAPGMAACLEDSQVVRGLGFDNDT